MAARVAQKLLAPARLAAARAPATRLCALPALQLNAPVVASSAARALLWQPQRGFASSSFLDKADVTDRVMGCLKNFQKVDPTKVSETSHFLNDLGLDSLDTVEVVMAFEDEFCIEVCGSAAPPPALPPPPPLAPSPPPCPRVPPCPQPRHQPDQRPVARPAAHRSPTRTPRRSTPARTRSATSFSTRTPSEEGRHELCEGPCVCVGRSAALCSWFCGLPLCLSLSLSCHSSL